MKKVLLQLDTDEHPSPFDAIVAHDAGVDVLLSHGGVKPEDVRALVQDAFFTRGVDDLKTMAVWVGGKRRGRRRGDLRRGAEGVLRSLPRLRDARLQRLQHDRGHDDRADREGAQPRRAAAPSCSASAPSACGRPCCCARRAARSRVAALPPDLFGDDRPYRRPRGLGVAQELGLDVREPADRGELEALARRGADRPVRRARRRARCCAATSGRSTRRSSCSPTTTRRSRWASRARRRPTTWPTTTASSCSARWRSAARR